MIDSAPPVAIAFRIPGCWSHPKELVRQLPAGYRLTGDHLVLPDRTEIEFDAGPPDQQFPDIFRSSLRQPATAEELATVAGYTVNVFLKGPGGSLDAARTMMRAGAAVVQAGGAGVFIDNSTVAHGGSQWLGMAEDGSPDALSFAFVAIVRGRAEIYTLGMHALGYPDIVMKRSDVEEGGFDIVDVIRYVAAGDPPVGHGHVIADESGPRFVAHHSDGDGQRAGTPHHNPFGRLKLVSMRDVAESN